LGSIAPEQLDGYGDPDTGEVSVAVVEHVGATESDAALSSFTKPE
jgi:hypothetical protein